MYSVEQKINVYGIYSHFELQTNARHIAFLGIFMRDLLPNEKGRFIKKT